MSPGPPFSVLSKLHPVLLSPTIRQQSAKEARDTEAIVTATHNSSGSGLLSPAKNTMSGFADDKGTPAAAHGEPASAPAPAPAPAGGEDQPPSEIHGAAGGGAVGGDLAVFPLRTAAGGAGMAGKKQMANILCCLCGRSIQPNGESERDGIVEAPALRPPPPLLPPTADDRRVLIFVAA